MGNGKGRAGAKRIEELRLDLARLAADRFSAFYLLDRALEINRDHVRLVEQLKETATPATPAV